MVTVVDIGHAAPDFRLPSLSGREVGLSDYLGRRVALFVWASW